MNKNINLVELLKDCPKGTKFYTPIYGEVEFNEIDNVSNFPIRTKVKGNHISFTKEGYFTYLGTPECMLFPSKDQRDWSKYQRPFKNGDIITSKGGGIALFSHTQTRFECSDVVYYHCVFFPSQTFKLGLDYGIGCVSDCKLATEEEKQKLFQEIKDNGYKWNVETKILEKLITPKFKVGDIIQDEDSYKVKITFVDVEDEFYEYESLIAKGIGTITFHEQDDWKLVLNKFDISTLKPFDKVLVKYHQEGVWVATLFSHIADSEEYPYVTTYIAVKYCIPYNNETKHLVETTNEAPEFYINW